jgi:hypothetical protein
MTRARNAASEADNAGLIAFVWADEGPGAKTTTQRHKIAQ